MGNSYKEYVQIFTEPYISCLYLKCVATCTVPYFRCFYAKYLQQFTDPYIHNVYVILQRYLLNIKFVVFMLNV